MLRKELEPLVVLGSQVKFACLHVLTAILHSHHISNNLRNNPSRLTDNLGNNPSFEGRCQTGP